MLEWLFPIYSTCILCGREDISSYNCGLCKDCLDIAPFATENNTIFYYEDGISRQIQNLKYNNKRYLAKVLVELGREKLDALSYDIVTFVPTRNRKKRGYNQAELIARAIDDENTIETLAKIRDTVSQTKLSIEERKENVKDCFEVIDGSKVMGKRVLLVDDVYTTGSTIKECAKMLILSGAVSIIPFTVCMTRKE